MIQAVSEKYAVSLHTDIFKTKTASKMVIYKNNECILKKSGRFSNKSSKWKTELKSGGLPRKTVDLMCMQI